MKNTSEKTKKKSKTGTSYKRTSEMGLDVENQRDRKIRRQEESEDEDLLDDE